MDMTINVTATAKADPSKKVACTFYVKKKISQGEVGELTAAMIEAIGNSAITVSGTITDIYKDLKTSSNSTSTAYSMTVKMEDGKWSGRHNAVENELNVISNTYLRGENIVTDSLGISGYALQESYIDRHNTATVVPVTDYQGYPSVWEEQHLFNHMGQFDVTRFKFDESVGAYEYQIEHINERGDNYYGSDGKVDMTKPAANDDYLMTYLAPRLPLFLKPAKNSTCSISTSKTAKSPRFTPKLRELTAMQATANPLPKWLTAPQNSISPKSEPPRSSFPLRSKDRSEPTPRV